MLEVKPIQSKVEQEAVCARCGSPYDADLLAYAATVDGELIGVCQFTLAEEGGSVRTLGCVPDRADDFEAMFVLGRAALNFIDLCGVHRAAYDAPVGSEAEERLIRAIGFAPDTDGHFVIDLTHFFEHPCQHDTAPSAERQNPTES